MTLTHAFVGLNKVRWAKVGDVPICLQIFQKKKQKKKKNRLVDIGAPTGSIIFCMKILDPPLI